MAAGTLLFVHGTGVRVKAHQKTFDVVRERGKREGIAPVLVECEWGDAYGVDPPRRSIPEQPEPEQLRREEEAQREWSYLQQDPFFELRMLTIDARHAPVAFGKKPPHEELWERIRAYQPTPELEALLERAGVLALWPTVWQTIVESTPIAREAVFASGNETADVASALARALFAELTSKRRRKGIRRSAPASVSRW